MKFMTIVSTLFAAAAAVSAAPVEIAARDVWAPKILIPNADTVWSSGQTQTVTWDLSSKPNQITNPTGFIVLRSAGVETSVVLAHDFQLTDGHVDITVPEVITRNDWSLVLFGDSGNWSEDFTINGLDL